MANRLTDVMKAVWNSRTATPIADMVALLQTVAWAFTSGISVAGTLVTGIINASGKLTISAGGLAVTGGSTTDTLTVTGTSTLAVVNNTGLQTVTNTLGSFSATGNPVVKMNNLSASAQTPVDFFSNAVFTGRIRNDFAGNMSYVSLLSGLHDFFVGGDSGVGVLSFEIKSGKINLAGHATTATAPGAGGAGALPATPAGYVTLQVAGTDRKIAYY